MRLLTYALLLAAAVAAAVPAQAQTPDTGTEADHLALIKLRNDIGAAIGKRDLSAVAGSLHKPFTATVVTQDTFTDFGKLKAYFDSLYTTHVPQIKTMTVAAEADERAQIYQGTFAVARGDTRERYELTDGRSFDLNGRWTATLVKDGDAWKLLAVHTGVNFLDNPVIALVGKSNVWTAAMAAGLGLLAGFVGGWFARRGRQR